MEGPFRVNLHEGAFSILVSFRELEVNAPIASDPARCLTLTLGSCCEYADRPANLVAG